MQIDVEVKNYRCFPISHPARISLRPGFTALVGVNNAGKSSLLKFFYEFRPLFEALAQQGNASVLAALSGNPQGVSVNGNLHDVFCDMNNADLEIHLRVAPLEQAASNGGVPLAQEIRITINRTTLAWVAREDLIDSAPATGGALYFSGNLVHKSGHGPPIADLSLLQEAGRMLSRTLYIGPFRNAINIGTNQSYYDIQVGQAMIQTWRHWKTGGDKRTNEAAFRLTDDIRRIFSFDDLEINPSPDDTTLQVFVNGRSYRLGELGAGLSQFFLVLANVAVHRPSFILIDEPELNLHPSLQVDFLTSLASYASNGVLFATHSIGLARAVGNRVYSVHRRTAGSSEVMPYEQTPRLAAFLGELSFSSYEELGFDRILLVEGPTEVQTIQQFLRLYSLDHKVVLLPLGGASLINGSVMAEQQLEEIKRISPNIAAVIDSERPNSGARAAKNVLEFERLCKKADIPCHILERRAIENYFTTRAVIQVKGEAYRALGPYEKLGDVAPHWTKSSNWQIARAMTRDDLDETDLGVFLAGL